MLSPKSFPHRIARSRAMTSATMPSIFSVDFSLSGLMLPAESRLTTAFPDIHRSTGLPPCWIRFSSNSRISSLDGGDISRKPCPNCSIVNPISSKSCAICTAPQRSKAISLIWYFFPRSSMNFSMNP